MDPLVDFVHAEGVPKRAVRASPRFLSVWFRCCHTYGRMYRDRSGTRYEGRCPQCGGAVRAGIGPDGTTRRSFEAR